MLHAYSAMFMLHLPAVLRPPCTPTGLLRHFKEYRVARYGPPLLQVQHMYSTWIHRIHASQEPLWLPRLTRVVRSPVLCICLPSPLPSHLHAIKNPENPSFLFFRLTSPWRLNILVCTSFYRLDLHLSTNSIFGDLSFLFSCLWHLQTITILDIQSSITRLSHSLNRQV